MSTLKSLEDELNDLTENDPSSLKIMFLESKINAIKSGNVQDSDTLSIDNLPKDRHNHPLSSVNSSAEEHLHKRQYGIEAFKPQLKNPIRTSGLTDGKRHHLKSFVSAVAISRNGSFRPRN